VETNQCYDPTTPAVNPDPLYATVEGTNVPSNIPVDANESYGIMTPSARGELSSQEDYEYIP
jgi:hypothetical protein